MPDTLPASALRGRRILVVEDEYMMAERICGGNWRRWVLRWSAGAERDRRAEGAGAGRHP
jgi:hypothetical protein